MNITIIGCGVSGLTCGVLLAEAGHAVQIFARDLPPHTTSNVAAAVWYPYKAFPEDRVQAWAAASYAVFDALLDESAGVSLVEGIELFRDTVDDPWWKRAVPSFRRARAEELPEGFADGYVFSAHVIEMDVYLPYLMRRFERAGGAIEQRAVRSVAEAEVATEVVVNCTGLGARELVGDTALVPIRGQIMRVEQVGVSRFTFDDHGPGGVTYIVPRSNDIILGGTAEEGRELLSPEPETAASIAERCAALEPSLNNATLLEQRVGLRPGRASVRLERETLPSGVILIHNYGHGGAGVTLSWGCAGEVVDEVRRAGR